MKALVMCPLATHYSPTHKLGELVHLPERLVDQLDRMYQLVGSDRLECIRLGESKVMWVSRDRDKLRLPVNQAATREAAHKLGQSGYVRGDALVTAWDGVGEIP